MQTMDLSFDATTMSTTLFRFFHRADYQYVLIEYLTMPINLVATVYQCCDNNVLSLRGRP